MIKIFMLQVIEKDGICFSFASDKLKNDKEFIIQAIKKDMTKKYLHLQKNSI